MAGAAELKSEIINSGIVLDPERTHHEFASGMHGRKLDFGSIERKSPLYDLWIETVTGYIREEFPRLPQVIMGVAKGANLPAMDVARHFGDEVRGMASRKDMEDPKKLYLSYRAVNVLQAMKPALVVVFEDVGTTGLSSGQVAEGCLEAGAQNVEVVTTWQRTEKLERLEEAGIPYRAIINETLSTYDAEDCREEGLCAAGWELIPYEQKQAG